MASLLKYLVLKIYLLAYLVGHYADMSADTIREALPICNCGYLGCDWIPLGGNK